MEEKDHPLDSQIRRVREIILAMDERVEEAMKWKSPTVMYKGSIAFFFMNAKKHVSLMFHTRATIDDPNGLLEGEGKEGGRRSFTVRRILKKRRPLSNS